MGILDFGFWILDFGFSRSQVLPGNAEREAPASGYKYKEAEPLELRSQAGAWERGKLRSPGLRLGTRGEDIQPI